MRFGALPQGEYNELQTDIRLLEVTLDKADEFIDDGSPMAVERGQRIYENAKKTLAYIWRKYAPPGTPQETRHEVWRHLAPIASRLVDHGVTPALGKIMDEPFRPLPRSLTLPVRLTVGDNKVTIDAVLDTGATSSVIGLDVAEKLGLKALMARSRSGIAVGGRITKFRTYVDKLEVFGWPNKKEVMCSIGPVHMSVVRFGGGHQPMAMLLGNDISAHLRMSIILTPKKPIVKCSTPKKLVEVYGLGSLLGLW